MFLSWRGWLSCWELLSLLVVHNLSLPLVALSLSVLSRLSLSFSVRIVVSSLSFVSLSFPVPPFLLSPSLSALSFSESVLMRWLSVVELLVFSEQSPHELAWAWMLPLVFLLLSCIPAWEWWCHCLYLPWP